MKRREAYLKRLNIRVEQVMLGGVGQETHQAADVYNEETGHVPQTA
jgi:hypothetical protein